MYKALNGKYVKAHVENSPLLFKFQEAPHPSLHPRSLCLTEHKPISIQSQQVWEWDACLFHIWDSNHKSASCFFVMTPMFSCVFCVGFPLQCHYVVAPLHRNVLHLSLLHQRYRDFYLAPAFTCGRPDIFQQLCTFNFVTSNLSKRLSFYPFLTMTL